MAYVNGNQHGSSGYGDDYEPPEYDYNKPKCAVCGGKPNQMCDWWESYGIETCSDCDKWLLTLSRDKENEQTIYIMNAVFEYIQCANNKYIECHDRYAMETERTLHYKDIINMGHTILIGLASEDIEIEYNMAMYIKGLQS